MNLSKRKFILLDESSWTLEGMRRLSSRVIDSRDSHISIVLKSYDFIKLNTDLISELIPVNPEFQVKKEQVDGFVSFVTGKKLLLIEKNTDVYEKSLINQLTGKDISIKFEEIVMSNGNRYITIIT